MSIFICFHFGSSGKGQSYLQVTWSTSMLFLMENLAMLLDKKTVKTSKTLFWLHRLPKHAPKPAEDQHIKLHRESAVANRQGIKLIYNLFNPYWKVVLIRKTKKEHCKNKKNCQIAPNLISSKLVARALRKICERSKHNFFLWKIRNSRSYQES